MFSFFRKSKKDEHSGKNKARDINNKDQAKETKEENNRNEKEINNREIVDGPYVENTSNFSKTNGCKSVNVEHENPKDFSVETSSNFATTSEKMCKNNQPSDSSSGELALQENNDAAVVIALPKNVVNAAKSISNEAATFYEKNDAETMSEYSYVNGLKLPEPTKINRRGSCSVKPCGHGTTAIAPRVAISGGNQSLKTPPESPVLEIKKTLRYKVNDIQETDKSRLEAKQVKDNELKSAISEIKEESNVNKGLQDQIDDAK